MTKKVVPSILTICLSFLLLSFFGKDNNSNDFKYLIEDEKNTISIFQNNIKSVVNITSTTLARRSFWDFEPVEIESGAGSGFVWDEKGHIVTNAHVVSQGSSFQVKFHKDKKKYKARLVAKISNQDTAVLKLIERPSKLQSITLGTSKNLMVGQKTVAIGNPFSFDSTITTGIISALNRKMQGFGQIEIHGMIQTDASINPGNSGGPLLNSSGQLIGMNTMIAGSRTSSGIGFAVPVDTIKRIVPQLIKYQQIRRPGLGISLDPRFRTRNGKGLIVSYVDPSSSASRLGLRGKSQDGYGNIYPPDIILSINGKETNSYNDIYHILDKYEIGDTVEVEYLRDLKKIKRAKIKLTQVIDKN